MSKIQIDWSNLTLEDKIAIDNVTNSDLDETNRIKSYIYILFNKEIDDIPLKELDNYLRALNFLNEPLPLGDLKKKYVINGTTYVRTKDINTLTSGQYLDYINYISAKNVEYNKLISTILIPEGHKYCDGYDTDKVFEDMLQINVVDLNTIANFLERQSLKCIKNSVNCSILNIWKTKGLTLKQKIQMTRTIDRGLKLMERSTI